MRKWLIIVCSLLLCELHAQVSDYRTDKLERLSLSSGDMVMGKSLDAPETVGSRFLYDDWLPGDFVTFTDEQYQHIKIRYDVENNALAAVNPRGGKEFYLATSKVKEFSLKGRRFVNMGAMSDVSTKENGFIEVLFSGPRISIVRRHFTQTLKPTYKEGLNMGTRDFRIVKKEELQFLLKNSFVKVPGKRIDFVQLFGDDDGAIEKYIKDQRLNLKSTKDLIQLAAFYNQLE